MLPSVVRSVYHQYKADTDIVPNWVGTTATAHGFHDQDQAAAVAGQPGSNPAAARNGGSGGSGGRPKGKGRKKNQAKKITTTPGAGGASAADKQSAHGKNYVLKLNEFEPMAAFIANKDTNNLQVPSSFAIALDKEIRGSFG